MTNAKPVATEKVQEPLRYYIGPYPGMALRKLHVALVAVNNAGGCAAPQASMRSSRGGRPWTSSSPTWS